MYRFKVTPVVSQTSSNTGTLTRSTVAAWSDDDDDEDDVEAAVGCGDGLAGENATTLPVQAIRKLATIENFMVCEGRGEEGSSRGRPAPGCVWPVGVDCYFSFERKRAAPGV